MIDRKIRFIICLCPECRHAEGRGEYTFTNNDEERDHHITTSGRSYIFHEIRYHIHDWVCEHEDRMRCLLVRDYIPNDTGGFKAIPKENMFR